MSSDTSSKKSTKSRKPTRVKKKISKKSVKKSDKKEPQKKSKVFGQAKSMDLALSQLKKKDIKQTDEQLLAKEIGEPDRDDTKNILVVKVARDALKITDGNKKEAKKLIASNLKLLVKRILNTPPRKALDKSLLKNLQLLEEIDPVFLAKNISYKKLDDLISWIWNAHYTLGQAAFKSNTMVKKIELAMYIKSKGKNNYEDYDYEGGCDCCHPNPLRRSGKCRIGKKYGRYQVTKPSYLFKPLTFKQFMWGPWPLPLETRRKINERIQNKRNERNRKRNAVFDQIDERRDRKKKEREQLKREKRLKQNSSSSSSADDVIRIGFSSSSSSSNLQEQLDEIDENLYSDIDTGSSSGSSSKPSSSGSSGSLSIGKPRSERLADRRDREAREAAERQAEQDARRKRRARELAEQLKKQRQAKEAADV